ncbi:hypothetical protein OH77DRAFT_121190 [Trametes cingulata]|nr:hypothetical protein OH77DRAFT_121190 [Trametes cingulata]
MRIGPSEIRAAQLSFLRRRLGCPPTVAPPRDGAAVRAASHASLPMFRGWTSDSSGANPQGLRCQRHACMDVFYIHFALVLYYRRVLALRAPPSATHCPRHRRDAKADPTSHPSRHSRAGRAGRRTRYGTSDAMSRCRTRTQETASGGRRQASRSTIFRHHTIAEDLPPWPTRSRSHSHVVATAGRVLPFPPRAPHSGHRAVALERVRANLLTEPRESGRSAPHRALERRRPMSARPRDA